MVWPAVFGGHLMIWCCPRLLRFGAGIGIAMLGVGMALSRVPPCNAALPAPQVRSPRFWRYTAYAVVKVLSWRWVAVTDSAGRRSVARLARVHVLGVVATQQLIRTDTRIYIRTAGYPFPLSVGPIRPGWAFLVCMTAGTGHRWWLNGEGGPAMPKGLDSWPITGLSDPLVKKIQAMIEKLIVLAHARK